MRETVLRALAELDRWELRQGELRTALSAALRTGRAPDGRTSDELRVELEKVNRQVSYYQALTHDMKKQSRPAKLSDMLRTLFQP